ncbi:MAG: TetR family transcriptional regulator [Hydrocarboniphaga sp.]|uniref:TetR/AcrR family transcriptional regulator n=1 Tax=Hydrocarboniphaga sp. TaxID=2033016 RepID=UPI00261D0FA4|nr:TetR/AcrR family transcriptional regulator [Hydrocarboniphaga sp.]MDB5968744.1 TetR family transcriptional regulator [Hydrocarboniphaga sp.]
MKPKPDSVKIERAYHHGSLRAALIDAAEDVLAERGVEGFSLRETARRAGVSPAAPKHHFADTRALLTALAAGAYSQLAERLESAEAEAGKLRAHRIRAQGLAYVGFALDQPALFDLMWRAALLDFGDENLLMAKERAFNALDRLVRAGASPPASNTDAAMAPTMACWSLVHGFARLALDGAFGTDKKSRQRAVLALLPAVIDLLVLRGKGI